jgi:hypothetical protein
MADEEMQEDVVDSAPEVDSSAPETSAAPEQQVEESAEPQQGSVWDAFKSVPGFEEADERAIAEQLYGAWQARSESQQAIDRYQQALPVLREYLTYRDKFREYRDQQQAPLPVQVEEPPEQPRWWNPPQVRESYKRFLVRDENGREVISDDAPLEAKHELYEYQQYKAEFAQKFLADPESTLGPMVEQIAQQKAREIVDNQFADYGEEQYVSSLEQQNSDWLFGEDGQPTEEGLAISKYIDKAAQLGISTAEARWEYATDQLERDLLNQLHTQGQQQQQQVSFNNALNAARPPAPQQTEAPPAQNQAEKDIQYLRREASRNPSRSSSSPDPRIPQAKMSFKDRLAANLARNGITQ